MDIIIEAIKDVHNKLGHGLTESIYQKALALNLKSKFATVEREKSVPIVYLNHEITTLKADIVVNNEFVIELKATTTKLTDKDRNQIQRYMKILDITNGTLVNSGLNV